MEHTQNQSQPKPALHFHVQYEILSDDHPAVDAAVVGVEYLDEDDVEVAATSSLSVERLRPNLCLTELSMLTSRLRLFWKSGRRPPVGQGSDVTDDSQAR